MKTPFELMKEVNKHVQSGRQQQVMAFIEEHIDRMEEPGVFSASLEAIQVLPSNIQKYANTMRKFVAFEDKIFDSKGSFRLSLIKSYLGMIVHESLVECA